MSDVISKYMSDLYSNIDMEDMRQTVEYRYVKAYPSVNSTNGSVIHSESNVRWLTKQFTKKPFIIPRDGNPTEDKFKYGNGATGINGTYVAGGMANIDGYIVSIANDVNKVLFDYNEDTEFGSDSSGVIWTQIIQRTIIDLSKQLQNVDFKTYISTILSELEEEGLSPTAENIKANANEKYRDLMDSDTKEPQKIGEITIEYHNIDNIKIVEYIESLPTEEYNKFTRVVGTDDIYYTSTYDILLGFPKTYYKIEDETNPFIYIQDNFGLIFTFYNALDNNDNQTVVTHFYPSTHDDRVPMQNILSALDVDAAANLNIINQMVPADGNSVSVYNMNTVYSNNVRDDNNLPTTVDFDEILNSNFDRLDAYNSNTSINSVLGIYCQETGVSLSSLTELPTLSYGTLADTYYCMRLSNSNPLGSAYSQVLKYFSLEAGSLTFKPVSIFNSAGTLTPFNVDFKYNGATYTAVEGYLTFIRRVTKWLINPAGKSFDGVTFEQEYYDNPNGDGVTNPYAYRMNWQAMFKYFEKEGIKITTDIDTIKSDVFNDDEEAFYTFFGVDYTGANSYADIKFHHIYNLFIAPYMNTYMQIAWTSMFKNGVLGTDYTATKCLDILRGLGKTIEDDEYWTGKISLAHTYPNSTITVNYKLTEDADMFADGERLQQYLCNETPVTFTEKSENNVAVPTIQYREKATDNIFSDALTAYQNCEDYITYLKRCSSPTRQQNYTNVSDNLSIILMSIPYKVTQLKFMNSDILYNEAIDDVRCYKDNDNYPADAPSSITPSPNGYIQNVQIDLNTMIPRPNRSTNNNYLIASQDFWCEENSSISKKTYKCNYTLNMTNIASQYYTEGHFTGLDGFNFIGYTQDWITFVPIVFRLYKDGQNYLAGKNPGESTDAGIVVDYKFPKDLLESDLWFATAWLNTRRGCVSYNIENNGADWPDNTDGILNYLSTRNETIFNVDKIYAQDEKGNYISFNQYVNNYIENNNVVTNIESNITHIENTLETDVTNLTLKSYEKCVNVSSVESIVGEELTLVITPRDNYLYQNTDCRAVDDLTLLIDKDTIILNYNDSPINNTFRVKTVLSGDGRIYIQSNHPSISITDNWILNCDYTPERGFPTQTGDDIDWWFNLNIPNNRDIEAIITITITPNHEHYINIEPVNAITYPSRFTLDALTLESLGIRDIANTSWEKITEYTQKGWASKLWNIGDKKQFTIQTTGGTTQTITATIVGFDCDPSINALSNVKHHILWMTNLCGSTLSDNELINIGMSEDGTELGFKVNQGSTQIESTDTYSVNKKYTNSNSMFLDGDFNQRDYEYNPNVNNWLRELTGLNIVVGQDSYPAVHIFGFTEDVYSLITNETTPWWWGNRKAYTKSGDTYTEVTFTNVGGVISPSYSSNTYYLKNDMLVSRQYDGDGEGYVSHDISTMGDSILKSYNICMFGEDMDYAVGVPFSNVYSGLNTFWLPSLKEMNVTSQMHQINDTVENLLYNKYETDIRDGNTSYTYNYNGTDYTYTINAEQGVYTAFKDSFTGVFSYHSSHSERNTIITRDCFAVYNPDFTSIDQLIGSGNSYDAYCTITDGQTLEKQLVVIRRVGNGRYTELQVQPRQSENTYFCTEFCFATK